MKNLLHREQFYKNLTPVIQGKIIHVLKASKIKNISYKISFFVYCSIGFVFIYYLKKIFFTSKYFYNLDNLFNFTKFIIIINGSILISAYITKTPNENYNKAIISLKNHFLLNICNCKFKCNCKNELVGYFKKQGIDLLK